MLLSPNMLFYLINFLIFINKFLGKSIKIRALEHFQVNIKRIIVDYFLIKNIIIIIIIIFLYNFCFCVINNILLIFNMN